MGFADVHGQKIGAVLVIVVEFCEVAYLAAKRRSGVAAEDEDQRALAEAIAESESRLAIERNQLDIGRLVADAQVSLMPTRQRVAEKSIDVARPADEITERTKARRQDENQRNRRPFPPAQVQHASL